MFPKRSFSLCCCALAIACVSVLSAAAQTADDLDTQAALQVKNLKEEDALNTYKQVLVLQPDNLAALVGAGDMSCRIGARLTPKEKEKAMAFYNSGQDYASRALKVDSTSSDAHLVMAIALAKMAQLEGGKRKVESLRDIKTYVDKAIELNRNNFRAYYVLGRWNYVAGNLSSMERASAKVFYGGAIPQASLKEAIRCYEKCRSVNPSYIANYLDLAKAYKDDDQNEKALAALTTLTHLPVQTEDDPAIKAEGKKMLDSMQ